MNIYILFNNKQYHNRGNKKNLLIPKETGNSNNEIKQIVNKAFTDNLITGLYNKAIKNGS